jgi:hypothetical protein
MPATFSTLSFRGKEAAVVSKLDEQVAARSLDDIPFLCF